jgi:hypothetical protein
VFSGAELCVTGGPSSARTAGLQFWWPLPWRPSERAFPEEYPGCVCWLLEADGSRETRAVLLRVLGRDVNA